MPTYQTGLALEARPEVTPRGAVVRAGQSPEAAALVHRYLVREWRKEVTIGLGRMARAARVKGSGQ